MRIAQVVNHLFGGRGTARLLNITSGTGVHATTRRRIEYPNSVLLFQNWIAYDVELKGAVCSDTK